MLIQRFHYLKGHVSVSQVAIFFEDFLIGNESSISEKVENRIS
ncbi:hypothetical protein [Clostridium gasigenes]|nr:hypothetical protein [Clostridium gasigenes]